MPAANRPSLRSLLGLLSLLLATILAVPTAGQWQSSRFFAHLSAASEVPANDSLATGQAFFDLNSDSTELRYTLIAANIENVTAAHIHLAQPGVNGPVVAFLFGSVPPAGGRFDGVLATGVLTAANLVGPLAGQTLADLIAQLRAGNAYVNVHTNDGVAPTNTGPGDFPGGEIRGQIRAPGPPQ